MGTKEGVHPAHEVSVAFLKQYFPMLRHMPYESHRFYVDASVVSRPGSDGTMISFTSVEAINKHILSCDYEGTTFEVLRVDSHNTLEDGIFIMVICFLTQKDNLKRKFSQMFYLARQNGAYVILNDIFRYLDDEEASTPTTLPVVESETEVAKPADEINKTEPIHKTDADDENWIFINAADVNNAATVKNVIAGATPPLDNGNNEHFNEKGVTAQKPKVMPSCN